MKQFASKIGKMSDWKSGICWPTWFNPTAIEPYKKKNESRMATGRSFGRKTVLLMNDLFALIYRNRATQRRCEKIVVTTKVVTTQIMHHYDNCPLTPRTLSPDRERVPEGRVRGEADGAKVLRESISCSYIIWVLQVSVSPVINFFTPSDLSDIFFILMVGLVVVQRIG